MRVIWLMGGGLSFLSGLAGVVLPLVPTVPFMLLAAYCFARSSDRLHDWLLDHPRFGPGIRDWRARGAISRRGKRVATASVAAAFGLSFAVGVPAWVLAVQAAALACVLVFIWTRPGDEAPAPGP